MTIMAPGRRRIARSTRSLLRLSTFFDDGSVELLHEGTAPRVLRGRDGQRCAHHRVLHRRHRHGRRHGVEGCRHIVNAYDTAIEEQSPIVGIWHSGGARLAEG